MAGGAVYPANTYAHTGAARDATWTQTEMNNLGDEIQTIEETLGVNPHQSSTRSKNYATVDARLEDLEAMLVALANAGMTALLIANNATTPNSQIDVSCSLIAIQGFVVSGFSATLDDTVVGANGRDTATAIAINTWYRLWAIYNPTTSTAALLLSPDSSGTSPTLPAGYTSKRRIGYVRTDASGNFLRFQQQDNWLEYDVTSANAQVLTGGTSTTFVTTGVTCSTRVPPSSRRAHLELNFSTSTGTGSASVRPAGAANTPVVTISNQVVTVGLNTQIITAVSSAQQFEYLVTGTGASLNAYVMGYWDSI